MHTFQSLNARNLLVLLCNVRYLHLEGLYWQVWYIFQEKQIVLLVNKYYVMFLEFVLWVVARVLPKDWAEAEKQNLELVKSD